MTLTLEALTPFAFKESGALKTVHPGERFCLPGDKARKLLRLAEGKVRVLVDGVDLHPGLWVQFQSPLFGEATAQVEAVEIGQVWVGNHSVLRQDGPVKIPMEWVTRILSQS